MASSISEELPLDVFDPRLLPSESPVLRSSDMMSTPSRTSSSFSMGTSSEGDSLSFASNGESQSSRSRIYSSLRGFENKDLDMPAPVLPRMRHYNYEAPYRQDTGDGQMMSTILATLMRLEHQVNMTCTYQAAVKEELASLRLDAKETAKEIAELREDLYRAVYERAEAKQNPTNGPPPAVITLDPKDYPSVRWWYEDDYKKAEQEAKGNTTGQNVKKDVFKFLEDENGVRISRKAQRKLSKYTRNCIRSLDVKFGTNMPKTWDREAPEDMRTVLYGEIEAKHPILRLCEDRWKSEKLVIHIYSRWRHNHHRNDPVKMETDSDDSDHDSLDLNDEQDSASITATTTLVAPALKRKSQDATADRNRKRTKTTSIAVNDPLDTLFGSGGAESSSLSSTVAAANKSGMPAVETTSPVSHVAGDGVPAGIHLSVNIPSSAPPAVGNGMPAGIAEDGDGAVGGSVLCPAPPPTISTAIGGANSMAPNALLASSRAGGASPSLAVQDSIASDSTLQIPASEKQRYMPGKPRIAKNLCGEAWIKNNPDGLKTDFEVYWKTLPSESKKPFKQQADELKLNKTAGRTTRKSTHDAEDA